MKFLKYTNIISYIYDQPFHILNFIYIYIIKLNVSLCKSAWRAGLRTNHVLLIVKVNYNENKKKKLRIHAALWQLSEEKNQFFLYVY